jgi:type I restriction enzyme S subunit
VSKIDELIQALCPDGVEHLDLGRVAAYSGTRIDADTLNVETFVGVDNLLPNKAGRTNATYSPNTARLAAYEVGDILLGNIRPYLKKVWLTTNSGGCSGDVLAIRIEPHGIHRLTPEFLYYLLSSDDFFGFNMQHAKGAKMPRGSKSAILKYRIPLPPIEVQKEIVKILDKFTQLEAELSAELSARRKQYTHYRNQLLSFEDHGTRLTALGEVSTFKYGFTTKAKDNGKCRFLRITDITDDGNLNSENAKYVNDAEVDEKYLVKKDDLLVARTGATYGKTMHANRDMNAVYASFLIKINVDKKILSPRYYWHFTKSSSYWIQANSLMNSAGQPQFNANVLKKIKIPIPPLATQNHVVSILDSFDNLVSDISVGLPAEIAARRKQYEYYRTKLLTFQELTV